MRPRPLQRVLWILLCGSLGGDQLNDDGNRMRVELDVFSGRPNPRWELDAQSSRELRLLEKRLTPAHEPAPEPPGLGYRGFLYSDGSGSDDSGQVRAYRGFVKTRRTVLVDPSFTIETYLRDQLPAEYGELRNWIAVELAPK